MRIFKVKISLPKNELGMQVKSAVLLLVTLQGGMQEIIGFNSSDQI